MPDPPGPPMGWTDEYFDQKTTEEGGPGFVRRAPFLGELVATYLATPSLAFPAVSFAQSRGTSK